MALPLDLLEQSLNHEISILLKDGRTIEGKLMGYDQYMNLVVDEAEEKMEDKHRKLGKVVVRGSTIVSASF
jgi:small nuclear ribonucleoprotein